MTPESADSGLPNDKQTNKAAAFVAASLVVAAAAFVAASFVVAAAAFVAASLVVAAVDFVGASLVVAGCLVLAADGLVTASSIAAAILLEVAIVMTVIEAAVSSGPTFSGTWLLFLFWRESKSASIF